MRPPAGIVALAFLVLTGSCGGSPEGAGPAGPKVAGYVPGTMDPLAPTTTAAYGAAPRSTAAVASAPPAGTETATTASPVRVAYRVESRVKDKSGDGLAAFVAQVLADEKGWTQAGFEFVQEPKAQYSVVLAEPAEVDRLCLPLRTGGTVSCQNGPVVAINADRWRKATASWTAGLTDYRRYVVMHEVGHLIGLRHPAPQCPVANRPNAVMNQQTKGLEGCAPNSLPLAWELDLARKRPAVLAPDPNWDAGPPPRPPGS